ncbi:ankyrin repeat-containing domain protein [Aspergillus pseudoustus]|uniref:Ankyrin repeat-containing domain protein n=1 Tax=Aspergillus pseudoustus TaxID=1810923 RepID=A0ABR4J151_9EURO
MANPSIKAFSNVMETGKSQEAADLLDDGLSPIVEHFIIAIMHKHYDILGLFLDRGWDVNNPVPSTLVFTCEDLRLLQWFLRHGADPYKCCRIQDCTPLSYAIRDGSFDTQRGQLLHYAALRNKNDGLKIDMFIFLLEKGADPSIKDFCNRTALDYAHFNGCFDQIQLASEIWYKSKAVQL